MREKESELIVLNKPDGTAAAAAERAADPGAESAARLDQATQEPTADLTASTVSQAEFDLLKGERDQLLDRLARLQAEFENARKRAERERISDRDYATGNVVEQFLPVLDNFELALKSAGSADQMRQFANMWNRKR